MQSYKNPLIFEFKAKVPHFTIGKAAGWGKLNEDQLS